MAYPNEILDVLQLIRLIALELPRQGKMFQKPSGNGDVGADGVTRFEEGFVHVQNVLEVGIVRLKSFACYDDPKDIQHGHGKDSFEIDNPAGNARR